MACCLGELWEPELSMNALYSGPSKGKGSLDTCHPPPPPRQQIHSSPKAQGVSVKCAAAAS